MSKKKVKEATYKIIKDDNVKHSEIIDALADVFAVDVVGSEPSEDSSWSSVTLVIRRNGFKDAQERAREKNSE